jgi:hypothetical protein
MYNYFLFSIFLLLNGRYINFLILGKHTMLAEKEIGELIDKKHSSLRIVKPTITPKFSAVGNSFNCIYDNDIKQEYVAAINVKIYLFINS